LVGWSDSPFFQLTVAAASDALGVLIFRAFTVAATTPAPQASRRLPAVDSSVTKALAIVALGQTIFGLVNL
jgi:hypothetical protein